VRLLPRYILVLANFISLLLCRRQFGLIMTFFQSRLKLFKAFHPGIRFQQGKALFFASRFHIDERRSFLLDLEVKLLNEGAI
jgi:hypothetical protein